MEYFNEYKALKKYTNGNYKFFLLEKDNQKYYAKLLLDKTESNYKNIKNEIEKNIVFSNLDIIPKMHSYLLSEDDCYIIFDYLKNRTLKGKRYNTKECIKIGIDICDILSYFHQKNHIFRDLKLSNLMYDDHYIL